MSSLAKLQAGDEIRVVAPSNSWRTKDERYYTRGQVYLQTAGFTVSFGQNVRKVGRFGTASTADRLADLNAAYRDPNVKAILALDGGYGANDLLPGMDWQLIAANPKPLIGFSDITVLVNALYARTNGVQYLGPPLFRCGVMATREYTISNLAAVLTDPGQLNLKRSQQWKDVFDKQLKPTRPWKVLQQGSGAGVLIGGNLGSFYLLQGTPYQPSFDKPTILVVEDDDEPGTGTAREFRRRLESILQLPGVRQNLRGLLIGRFQPGSNVSMADIRYIVRLFGLDGIPVVADMDFGHTMPMLTLSIGGQAIVNTSNNQAQVRLIANDPQEEL